MKSLRPITTIKLWENTSIEGSGVLDSGAIDLRQVSQGARFSLGYSFGSGSGEVKLEQFTAPEKDGPFIEGSSDIAEAIGTGILTSTVSRAVASNVATIEMAAAQGNMVGVFVRIHDMHDSSYNGIHQVISMPDNTHITFALAHSDESETPDDGGSVVSLSQDILSFSPVTPTPWLKIKVTELDSGDVEIISIWLNIQ